jgi:AcrR family transcriptional regulator
MFDQPTARRRILRAALDCAAKKSWAEVSMRDVAEAANVPLGELRGEFESKDRIIAALLRAIDDEVLKRAPKPAEGQEARDVLFDVVMTRFDVLGPYKPALKSMHASAAADLALAGHFLGSIRWMLEAAGIGTEGSTGALRVTGLATVYASVFRVWLDDDDPGLARTMAALDRRLRRGERTMRNFEQAGALVHRLVTDAPGFLRSVMGGGKPKPEAGPTPGREAGTGSV